MTNPFATYNPVFQAHTAGQEVNPEVVAPAAPVAPAEPTAPVVTAPVVTPEVVPEVVVVAPVQEAIPVEDPLDALMQEEADREANEADEESESLDLDPDMLEAMTLEEREEFFTHDKYIPVRISSKKLDAEDSKGKKVVAREGYPSTVLYVPKLDFCNNPQHAEIGNELYARWIKTTCQQEENAVWRSWAATPPFADGSREAAPFVTNHREPAKNEAAAFAFFNGLLLPLVTDMETIEDTLYPTTHDDWVEWCLKGGFWDVMVAFYRTVAPDMAQKTPEQIKTSRTMASRIHADGIKPDLLNIFCGRLDAIERCTVPDVVAAKTKYDFSRYYKYHLKRINTPKETAADIF